MNVKWRGLRGKDRRAYPCRVLMLGGQPVEHVIDVTAIGRENRACRGSYERAQAGNSAQAGLLAMNIKPHWQRIGLGRANNNGVLSIYGCAPWPTRHEKGKGAKGKRPMRRKRATQRPTSQSLPACISNVRDPGPHANMGPGHLDPEHDWKTTDGSADPRNE